MIKRVLKVIALAVICFLIGVLCLSLAGCSTVGQGSGYTARESGEVVTIRNHYGQVASKSGDVWRIKSPPKLEFTGRTVTGREIRAWAAQHGIQAVGVEADEIYAQITAESAIECILWLKRFQWDIGYTYVGGSRDCDNFARAARTFPDFFAEGAPKDSQALVIGIYARMMQPFAGVSDGYHALNVAWTDAGVPAFEPQGVDLTYQALEHWPNRAGITHGIFD
jgi:hypothetical protein